MVFLNLKESPKGLLSGPVCVNYSSEIPELMIWHRKMRRRGEAVEVKELLSRNLKLSSQGLSCFSPPSPSYTHPIKESCPYYKSIGPFLSVDSLTLSFRLGESWGEAWNSASSATAMLRRSTAAVAEQPPLQSLQDYYALAETIFNFILNIWLVLPHLILTFYPTVLYQQCFSANWLLLLSCSRPEKWGLIC